MRSKYFAGDKIERNDMGGTCNTYGGREDVYTGFCWGNLRERDQLEDPGVDGRVVLTWIFRKWDVGTKTISIWFRIGSGGGHL